MVSSIGGDLATSNYAMFKFSYSILNISYELNNRHAQGGGRGRQLTTPNPPSRASAPKEDAGDLGVGVADWWPRPQIDQGLRLGVLSRFGVGAANRRTQTLHRGRRHPQRTPTASPVDSGSGPPIGDPDPSTEVVGVLCGCRRPRWRANPIGIML
ncbi:hypothetical protein CRG98_008436 [Punica granatum]|uniref:Uncharacterized protein n=1 Tax=Punica granatum TaxID=22663 RepID=A0A2I0KRM7_PUNGR|nr:hypothetical protein CRG98_008436 [Punica granatum]